MDCEKFEATMLDELYGELDELTVAASKRHVGGCARCAALIGGLRATRKIVTLPVLAPSAGFESRLLAAVEAAQAKPRLGMAQVISLAGRWAMRPQTAMAAVFLLMLGTTSSVLLSRRVTKSSIDGASSSFTVTENGAPAGPAATIPPLPWGDEPTIDSRAAAAAHGTAPMAAASAAPAAPAPYPSPPPESAQGLASGPTTPSARDGENSLARGDLYAPKSRASSKPMQHAASGYGGFNNMGSLGASGGGGGARSESKSAPSDDSLDQSSKKGPFAAAPPAAAAQAASPPPPPPAVAGKDSDPLAAARSLRDGNGGCSAAVAEYDRVAAQSFGSTSGYDATLEAAQCYARIGQVDLALRRYQRLLTVPAYAPRAQAGINAISQVAAKAVRKAAPQASPQAASAPAAPAAVKPAAPADPPSLPGAK